MSVVAVKTGGSSWLADIVGEVKADVIAAEGWIVTEAKAAAAVIGQDVKDAVGVVSADLKAAAVTLFPVIKQSIIDQIPKLVSGEEKFGAAVANVFQVSEAQGKGLAMGDCSALVQMFWTDIAALVSSL